MHSIDWSIFGDETPHVAFTGPRDGVTPKQVAVVTFFLSTFPDDAVLHHGDCVGGDEAAHHIALALGMGIHKHPPLDEKLRAHCLGGTSEQPLPYLMRDRAMVEATTLLIATPKTPVEELRSGTWTTVRYARRAQKTIVLVYPDGEVAVE